MRLGRNMSNDTIITGNMFPNKMIANDNVFFEIMLNRIDSHVGSANIVTLGLSSTQESNVELKKKLSDPNSFSNSASNCPIFSFGR